MDEFLLRIFRNIMLMWCYVAFGRRPSLLMTLVAHLIWRGDNAGLLYALLASEFTRQLATE